MLVTDAYRLPACDGNLLTIVGHALWTLYKSNGHLHVNVSDPILPGHTKTVETQIPLPCDIADCVVLRTWMLDNCAYVMLDTGDGVIVVSGRTPSPDDISLHMSDVDSSLLMLGTHRNMPLSVTQEQLQYGKHILPAMKQYSCVSMHGNRLTVKDGDSFVAYLLVDGRIERYHGHLVGADGMSISPLMLKDDGFVVYMNGPVGKGTIGMLSPMSTHSVELFELHENSTELNCQPTGAGNFRILTRSAPGYILYDVKDL